METNFKWQMSGSGDCLCGKIVYDKIAILSSKNAQNDAFKWVKRALKGTISPRFRLSILNSDETVKNIIPNSDIKSGGSFSENYQNGQRRSLNFALINSSGKYSPSVFNFWIGTKIKLESGFYFPDEEATVYFNAGIFVVTKITPSYSQNDNSISVDCGDKFSIFESAQGLLPEGVEIKSDIDILDIIKDVLSYQNGDGSPLDSKEPIYHSSFLGKTTPHTISLGAGSHWSELLTSLAEILSAEVFYDANGHLVFWPIVEVTQDGDKPVIKTIKDQNGTILNSSFSFDYANIINYVRVTGGTVNGHICVAIAKNEDPSSPINCSRIGYRYASPISDEAISSDVIAQERADYELRLKTIFTTSFSVETLYDPTLSVNNLIEYTDIHNKLYGERFLITGISYDLGDFGKMNMTISNINNLPFITKIKNNN